MPDHTAPPLPALSTQTRVHLVGIGGTGLSAIARVLLERGIPVSGSDRALNPVTDQLTVLGATVYAGHHADHISGAALVLMTSAAKSDNPEIAAARAAGIPVVNRRHFLPSLLGADSVIGVAGTHGKTTTTAMTTHILNQMGRKPGYIVGSVMQNTGTNA
ncbi:MAG: Mur ligase domain-containing protein, partial [Anaerolineae bacterium]|nr:Mur ligase domain-containing protein [Anaerolineae bacterium]